MTPPRRQERGLAHRCVCGLAAMAFLVLLGPAQAEARAGDLDPSFGAGGTVSTNLGGLDRASSVAIDSRGRMVAAGASYNGSDRDFALVRYRPNGTLDPNFGSGGKVTTDLGRDDVAESVAIDGAGRIVLAGSSASGPDSDLAVARYTPSGALDHSFSGDGKAFTDFGDSFDQGRSVAIDSAGRVVVAGYTAQPTYGGFALARYKLDGSLDDSFGSGGTVADDVVGGDAGANAVAIDSHGRIVAVGEYSDLFGPGHVLARYMPDGGRDTSFGTGGVVQDGFDDGAGNSAAIDSRGRIVIAGGFFDFDTGVRNLVLRRYTPDGELDGAFSPPNVEGVIAAGVAIDSSGRIVAAGERAGALFGLVRLGPDGALDGSFGDNGQVTTDFGGPNDSAAAVAIYADDRIVAAGESKGDFAVARYLGESPPTVTISSGPSAGSFTNDATPRFGFEADEPAAFECRVDGGALATCQSPYTAATLSDGPHSFTVRATDNTDRTGAATRRFTVDTDAPGLRVRGASKVKTRRRRARARFTLTVDEPARLQCRIDHTRFKRCRSRFRTRRLRLGDHHLKVRASDRAGNLATETKRFEIVHRG